MEDREEIQHLIRLKQGNLQSFKWVYHHHYEKVYYFCLALCRSPQDAEEITSDVFVKIWEKRAIIDLTISLRPLLFKITRDLSWNYLKRTASKERLWKQFIQRHHSGATVDGEAEIEFEEYLDLLDLAFTELTPQQQKVFTLRYIAGRDLHQIAKELSISKNTVKVHLANSKKAVLNYLKVHAVVGLLLLL